MRLCYFVSVLAFCVFQTQALERTAFAEDVQRELFDFSKPENVRQWQIVNDGVMGGRSSSQAELTPEGKLRFRGNLSLQNNGGFASVRSRPESQGLGLELEQVIVLRVKGDGRKYTFNLYNPDRRTAFSYQLEFATKAGEWVEVELPVSKFVAHSFGRRMQGMPLVAERVHSVGILLGDKKPGGFELLVDSIAIRAPKADSPLRKR